MPNPTAPSRRALATYEAAEPNFAIALLSNAIAKLGIQVVNGRRQAGTGRVWLARLITDR